MISIRRLDRDFHARRYEALLAAILAHRGINVPASLRVRLADHPACALGLTVQRVAELSYGSTPILREMVVELIQMQSPDGSIERDPLPTACLAHALGHLMREGLGDIHADLLQAYESALTALAWMLEPWASEVSWQSQGLIGFRHGDDRTIEDRAAVAAFVFMLMAGDSRFREVVNTGPLWDWLADHQHELDPATIQLWRAANLSITPPRCIQRMKQALAA